MTDFDYFFTDELNTYALTEAVDRIDQTIRAHIRFGHGGGTLEISRSTADLIRIKLAVNSKRDVPGYIDFVQRGLRDQTDDSLEPHIQYRDLGQHHIWFFYHPLN